MILYYHHPTDKDAVIAVELGIRLLLELGIDEEDICETSYNPSQIGLLWDESDGAIVVAGIPDTCKFVAVSENAVLDFATCKLSGVCCMLLAEQVEGEFYETIIEVTTI